MHEARRRASESAEPLSLPIDRCECIDRYFSPSSRRARSRFSPFVSPRVDRSIRVAGGRDARKIRSVFLYPNPPTIRDSSRNVHPRSHNRIHRSVDRWIDGSIANTAPSIAGKEKKPDQIDRSMKTPIESNRSIGTVHGSARQPRADRSRRARARRANNQSGIRNANFAIVDASEIVSRGSARSVRRTTSRRGRRDDDESVIRTRDARDDDARVDGDDWIVISGVVESTGVGIEEEFFAEDESTIAPRWKLDRGAGARKTRGDCGCGESGTMCGCGRERKAWTRRDVDSSGGTGIRGSNGRRR